jgi:probable rRNA maturation factor
MTLMSGQNPKRVRALRVTVADDAGRPMRVRGLARWLEAVAPGRARGGVAIAVVSDARMRRLNRRFGGPNRPTDVLSFPACPATGRAPYPAFLGDIAIARGVAARQAREAGHSVATECRILALHGLLHLLGHDHHGDGGRMDRLERRLRRQGGLPEGLIERAEEG